VQPAKAHVERIGPRVLLTGAVERLAEIAFAIQETHGDQRKVEIARRLEMVAGQNAESARIEGQAFVDTELGAEIRHHALAGIDLGFVVEHRKMVGRFSSGCVAFTRPCAGAVPACRA
jgi:hypothetical protein